MLQIKALTFQDPGHSKLLQSDERFIMQDQTTKVIIDATIINLLKYIIPLCNFRSIYLLE